MAVVKYKNSSGEIKCLKNVKVDVDSSEWRPQPDWWDIETLINEDTEENTNKMIILFRDGIKNLKFDGNSSIKKVKFNDGRVINNPGSQSFEWNTDFDKESSLGYKTRYAILYFINNPSDLPGMVSYLKNAIYIIFKKCNIVNTQWGSRTSAYRNLECIKFLDSTLNVNHFQNNSVMKSLQIKNCNFINITDFNSTFAYCYNLENKGINEYLSKVNTTNVTNIRYCFAQLYNLVNVINIDTSNVRDFTNCFASCVNLYKIEKLDFKSATSINGMFSNCNSLVMINNISNIKINGLNFSSCESLDYDTLIRIIEALHDYSTDTETHTITLGSTNLAKLTDEELAIGQDKGWTIN